MVDGANGVTNAPRQHFPQAPVFSFVALVGLLLSLLVLWRRRGAVLLGALAAAACVAGLWVVLAERADAPAQRPKTAQVVRRTLDDLQRRLRWPTRPVRVTREDNEVLFPLVRYALPSRPPPSSTAIELETFAQGLGSPCRSPTQNRVVCDGAPE